MAAAPCQPSALLSTSLPTRARRWSYPAASPETRAGPLRCRYQARRLNATVTLINTGDADLPADATLALYASPSRTLEPASVLLGQVTLPQPLAAGSSISVSIPASLKSLSPGQYHLLAAVDDHSGSAPTPIASQAEPFTVRAAAHHATRSAAHPFALRTRLQLGSDLP